MYRLVCVNCGASYAADETIYTCPKCGHLLAVQYDLDRVSVSREEWDRRPLSVWRYRELLPVHIEPVTLREGGTPLYRLDRIGEKIGLPELYAKHEGMNPSGSFKDRGMTIGVSMALQLKKKSVACASTGNTSASLAVYAAKAGIPAIVLLPAGKVALGKVAQALMHGARVISIRGNFDRALEMVHALCLSHGLYLLNSVNPYRLEGQKTIGFEAIDQSCSDRRPPVGMRQYLCGVLRDSPNSELIWSVTTMMTGSGKGLGGSPGDQRRLRPRVVRNPRPSSSHPIGPVNAEKALTAIRATGGTAETVTDEEILAMQRDLARLEGIGVEPASAASVAGVKKLVDYGIIDRDERVVCVVTGHLLKDPETVIRQCEPPVEIDADLQSLLSVLHLSS
jgi:threonine synthase